LRAYNRGVVERPDPAGVASLRASDADRERVAGILRDASAEGRLTLDELADRVGRAYAATTEAELEELVTDLPASRAAAAPAPSEPAQRKPRHLTVAVMSEAHKHGRWRVAENSVALAVMGSCKLDLRSAVLAGPQATITCIAIMGDVKVIVPPGLEVEFSGFGLMGNANSRVDEDLGIPGTPLVRVRAFALMGNVEVVAAKPKRSRRLGSEWVPAPPAPPPTPR
jgi:hypothetical protein